MRKLIICFILALSFLCSGCMFVKSTPDTWTPDQNFVYRTANTLTAAAELRKNTLKIIGAAWKDGFITDETAKKVIIIGDELQTLINGVSDELVVYRQSVVDGTATEIQYVSVYKKLMVFHDAFERFIQLTSEYM